MGNSSSKLKKYLYANDELAAIELYNASSELRKGFDPNLTFGESYAHDTPLHVASRHAMQTLIQLFLFQRNGNPNKRNSRDETSLHCVCMSLPQDAMKSSVQQRRLECLQQLLNWRGVKLANGELERVSTSAKDEKGNTALHYAAASGLRRCVELLIDQQPNLLYVENGQKQSPCDCAQMNNHLELAAYLESRMVFSEMDDVEEPPNSSVTNVPTAASSTTGSSKSASKHADSTSSETRVLKNANAAQISSRFCASSPISTTGSKVNSEKTEKARVLEDAIESYTGLSATDLQEVKDYVIVEVAEMLRIDLASAQALLLQHEWSRKQLLESWFSDPVKCCVKSGVSLPDWLATESSERPELLRMASSSSRLESCPPSSQSETATPVRSAQTIENTIECEHDAPLMPVICEICAGLIELRDTERVGGRLSCKHEFCAACWERYLTNKVQEGNVQSITCPAFGCAMVIGADMLERLVSRDVARKYLQFDVKAFVEANCNLKWCPHPGCGRVVMRPQRPSDPLARAQRKSADLQSAATSASALPSTSASSPPIAAGAEQRELSVPKALAALPDFLEAHRNELGAPGSSNNEYARALAGESDVSHAVDCGRGHAFCWECLGEAHEPVGCDRLKEWLDKCAQMNADSLRNIEGESEMAANYLWLVTNSKPCPSCRSPIQKNEGCNHMKCSKCKHDFCWVCLESWKKHSSATGGYFRCNRYEVAKAVESAASRQRDEAAARNTSLQQLSRFMHYYTRFQNHDHSLRLELPLLSTARNKAHSLARHSLADPTVPTSSPTCSPTPSDDPASELDFLERSVRELLRARRFLKYSYAYGYFIEGGFKKPVFESMQTDLEESTETLAEMLGRPYLKTPRWKIIDTARLVRRRRCEFTEALECGLIPAYDSDVFLLPRYAGASAARRRASLGLPPARKVIDEDMFRQLLEQVTRANSSDAAASIDPTTAWVKDKSGRHRNLNALLDAHRERVRRSTSNPPSASAHLLDTRPRSAAFSDSPQADNANDDSFLDLFDDEDMDLADEQASHADSFLQFDELVSYLDASGKQASASASQPSTSGSQSTTASSAAAQANAESTEPFEDFVPRRVRRRYGGFLDSFGSSQSQSVGFGGLFGSSSNRCRRPGCRHTRRRLITRLSDCEGYCSSHCMHMDRIANRHRKTPGFAPRPDSDPAEHDAPSSSTSPPVSAARVSPSRGNDGASSEPARVTRQLIPRDREVPSAAAARLNDAQMRMNYNYTLELLRALELSRIEYLREHSDSSNVSTPRPTAFGEATTGDEFLADEADDSDDYEQRLLQVALEMSLATPQNTDNASGNTTTASTSAAQVDADADADTPSTTSHSAPQAQTQSSSTTESSPC